MFGKRKRMEFPLSHVSVETRLFDGDPDTKVVCVGFESESEEHAGILLTPEGLQELVEYLQEYQRSVLSFGRRA